MTTRIKYPRTYHLPWSPGATSDDKVLNSISHFVGQEVVCSEKYDGECTTIYANGRTHARSLDSKSHPSRDWVRQFAAQVGSDIPMDWRICGENVFARHACAYTNLPSFFMAFGIYDGSNRCMSWDATEEWCALLNVTHVPVLYRGIWDEEKIKACMTGVSQGGGPQEGYVVRLADSFDYADFSKSVAKYVRPGHVDPNSTHWMHKQVTPNIVAVK